MAFSLMRAYRIVKIKRAATAFDGEGARRSGGRWNSVGTPLVYAASSIALACLEIQVHLDDPPLLPAYSVIGVEFEEHLMATLALDQLPPDWNALPAPPSCALIGDKWFQKAETPVLRVPSAVVPLEWNFLLNPRHADFGRIQIGETLPFGFDERLWKQSDTA